MTKIALGLLLMVLVVMRAREFLRNEATEAPPASPRAARASSDRGLHTFQRRALESSDVIAVDLGALGLDARKLQAMPIQDAYIETHAAARRVADTALRRRMLLDLFDELEE